MGNRIYGCDDCLAVCPWNKFAQAGREAKLAAREALRAPRLADLARLDDAAFRALFSKSPVKRTGRDRFVRNVLIAIGNSGDAVARQRSRAAAGRCLAARARRRRLGAGTARSATACSARPNASPARDRPLVEDEWAAAITLAGSHSVSSRPSDSGLRLEEREPGPSKHRTRWSRRLSETHPQNAWPVVTGCPRSRA